MARLLGRKPIGYDMRTGRKVRYADLVDDGENPSTRVHKRERDAEHPLKFPRTPGADRMSLYRPAPEAIVGNVTVYVGYSGDPDALYADRMQVPQITVTAGMALLTHDGGTTVV